MTVTFRRHGGIQEWDLTLKESYEAIYVSAGSPVLARAPANRSLASGSMPHPLNMRL